MTWCCSVSSETCHIFDFLHWTATFSITPPRNLQASFSCWCLGIVAELCWFPRVKWAWRLNVSLWNHTALLYKRTQCSQHSVDAVGGKLRIDVSIPLCYRLKPSPFQIYDAHLRFHRVPFLSSISFLAPVFGKGDASSFVFLAPFVQYELMHLVCVKCPFPPKITAPDKKNQPPFKCAQICS